MCLLSYNHYTACGCLVLWEVFYCNDATQDGLCANTHQDVIVLDGILCIYHLGMQLIPADRRTPPMTPVQGNSSSSEAEPAPGLVHPIDTEESSDTDTPWVPGQPDINRAAIAAALNAQGRLASSGSRGETTSTRLSDHPTYAERYNAEDDMNRSSSSVDGDADITADSEDPDAPCSNLGRLTVARARAQRERRNKAKLAEITSIVIDNENKKLRAELVAANEEISALRGAMYARAGNAFF